MATERMDRTGRTVRTAKPAASRGESAARSTRATSARPAGSGSRAYTTTRSAAPRAGFTPRTGATTRPNAAHAPRGGRPASASSARAKQARPAQRKQTGRNQTASPRRRGKRRQGAAVLRLIALVALLALALVLTKRRVFVLREVRVEGNRGYSASEIASMAGLTMGESIFDIDRAAVERGLSVNGDVKLVDFSVTWPDTVSLSVSERQARAAVNVAGVILLVDEDGQIMDRFSSVPEGSVVVSGMDVSISAQGRRIESAKSWQLGDMKNVLAEVDAQDMLSVISELNVADRYNLYLVSNTGVKIVLGDEENMAAKLVWARTVLEKLTQEGVRRGVLDVSTGKNAVYADR